MICTLFQSLTGLTLLALAVSALLVLPADPAAAPSRKGSSPPVKGFWSLTMYDPEHYFAPNALNRYALGTKNKTLKFDPDGTLTIYLGNKSPGKDKESSWLPAPAGKFSIWLRAYGPDPRRHLEAAGHRDRKMITNRNTTVRAEERAVAGLDRQPHQRALQLQYGLNAGLGWWFGAVVALVLATAIPSWSEDGSREVLTRAVQDTGVMPAYHLGAGKLDGDLGRVDGRAGDLAAGPFAQVAGPSGTAAATPAEPEAAGESASELNAKLTNPVSSIWSLQNQFNNFKLANGHWNNNWNFQPVLPVGLTKDWNLVTRMVMPLYNIVPHETAPGQFDRTAGLGDMTLLELLSPANAGNWILGAGPSFIFPTATSKFTGQGKVQAGPGVVVGYLTKEFILGLFPQQWFSIGGDPGRPDTSQLNLQPIVAIFFGDGWSVGYSGNILADWKAPAGDVWTVPIGAGIGKVVKLGRLPVKIQLSLQYMPVRPRSTGQEWDVQVQVTPVLPKLIKGALFE